jgi:hypothetical protein
MNCLPSSNHQSKWDASGVPSLLSRSMSGSAVNPQSHYIVNGNKCVPPPSLALAAPAVKGLLRRPVHLARLTVLIRQHVFTLLLTKAHA